MTVDEPNDLAAPLETIESEPQTAQPTLRGDLIVRFERWLDEMLAAEPPPRGLPEPLLTEASGMTNGEESAQETDLYALFSALTSLTGEIRLQGRAFKQLTDLLSPLSEMPAALTQLHDAQLESAVSIQTALAEQDADDADALPIPFKQVCDAMIDLYDRLQRGLQTCDEGIQSLRAPRPRGWKQRLLGNSGPCQEAILSVQAIRDASGLTLARLQAALQEWGVQRVGRVGEAFDAERMTVVEVRATHQVQPGSVLVVNRSGYVLNGALKATAQVTVSKEV